MGWFSLMTPVEPAEGAVEQTINFSVRSAASVSGRALAPDGEPLRDFYVVGAESHAPYRRNENTSFTVVGYFPTEPRRLIAYHPGRNLVGFHDLSGEPPERIDIPLRPAATFVGRLLDADGHPLEAIQITSERQDVLAAGDNAKPENRDRSFVVFGSPSASVLTDANGRFEIKGVIPGLKYSTLAYIPTSVGNRVLPQPRPLFTDMIAGPGETKDLGDLTAKAEQAGDDRQKRAAQAEPRRTDAAPANPAKTETVLVRGLVVDPAGKPVAEVRCRSSIRR